MVTFFGPCHCINFLCVCNWTRDSRGGYFLLSYLDTVYPSVGEPDPDVFEPPGSGSISQRFGSGSCPYLIKMLKALTDHLGGGSRVDSFDPQW